MALRPGYKQTEAGTIPEDWTVDTLESLTPKRMKFGIVDGPFGSNLKTIHYRTSGVPIVTSGFVTEGRFFADRYIYVDVEKFKQEKRSAVNAGDIVMAKIGARCGASAILPDSHEPGILSGNALKITVDEERHSTYFVWQLLWALYEAGKTDKLTSVGAQPAVSMPLLKRHLLPLPPTKAEQEAIAEALSDADALIESIEELIKKKRLIKQGASSELLTGKKRLPGFESKPGTKQTEVGEIPVDWDVRLLGDVAYIRNDKTLPTRVPPETLCVELEHVSKITGRLDVRANATASKSSKYRFVEGDILFGRLRSYLRKYWQADNDGICSTEIWPLAVRGEELSGSYLFQLVQMERFIEAACISYGTHMPRADWKVLSRYELSLPVLCEQQAISAVLSDMDAELEALDAKVTKARQIKQGMMHELLTGRIRLV